MAPFILFFVASFFFVIGCSCSSAPFIWPLPNQWSSGSAVVALSNTFQFNTDTPFNDLSAAFDRYHSSIFMHKPSSLSPSSVPIIPSLFVHVKNIDAKLAQGVDESYSLSIPVDGSAAQIVAETFYGALYGLETFSQIVSFNFTMSHYLISGAPLTINDSPRFSYRGVLIDTSRHFESIDTIKKVIDSLHMAKFNVLHWHVVDIQSFPLQTPSVPLLWTAAYSDEEKYSTDDVEQVIEYARMRGVRVMMEIDLPGHASSWCNGYPEICPSTTCLSPLDPSNPSTFSVINSLLGDVSQLSSEKFFHLGGDEVDTSCWTTTPHVQQWLTENNFTTETAYMYFVQKAHDRVLALGHDPVNWEEVFNHFGTKLDKQTIVHIWLDHATLAKVVAAGYRGILSNQDVWYLDHLGTTWQQFYENEPLDGIVDSKQQSLVLGGEVCMWGETVDGSDIFNTIWPRAAAAAERLWAAPEQISDTSAALPRLEWFRCFLLQHGIGAAPTNNQEGRSPPSGPGGCNQ